MQEEKNEGKREGKRRFERYKGMIYLGEKREKKTDGTVKREERMEKVEGKMKSIG